MDFSKVSLERATATVEFIYHGEKEQVVLNAPELHIAKQLRAEYNFAIFAGGKASLADLNAIKQENVQVGAESLQALDNITDKIVYTCVEQDSSPGVSQETISMLLNNLEPEERDKLVSAAFQLCGITNDAKEQQDHLGN